METKLNTTPISQDIPSILDVDAFTKNVLGGHFDLAAVIDKNQLRFEAEHSDSLP